MPDSPSVPSTYRYSDTTSGHMHPLIVPRIAEIIKLRKPKQVLDLGCGNGSMTSELKSLFPEIQFTAVDPSDEGIALANQTYARDGLTFSVGSVYDAPSIDWLGKFDLIYSAEVVEHLYFPRRLPSFAMKTLRPGGTVICTTPYHGYLKNLALSILNKWDFHHTVFWDHGHIKFWSRRTLTQLFTEEGFQYVSFRGIGRLPWMWMTMLIEFNSLRQPTHSAD